MNILIVKLSAIGDVVHILPSLSALRKLYPHAHIAWVIEEAASDLIKGHPYLDRVIVSRRKRWVQELKRGQLSALKEIMEFIRTLRSIRYDLVIDFHGLLKSSVIVFLARAKRKLGYKSMQELSGLFLNEKIPEDMNKHAVCRYLDFVSHLSRTDFTEYKEALELEYCEEGRAEFLIPVGEREEKKIAGLLESKGVAVKKFVAVNPVALWVTKLWDDESFARLCDLILHEYNLPVIFTGTEKKEIRRIQAYMKTTAINLAGETSRRELACLYRQAAVVVTTDSGPMHIAAAVGAPVAALFGPTDPIRTGPYGKGHRVIRSNLSCSPCFLKKCPTRECMYQISVDEVFHAVGDLLMTQNIIFSPCIP